MIRISITCDGKVGRDRRIGSCGVGGGGGGVKAYSGVLLSHPCGSVRVSFPRQCHVQCSEPSWVCALHHASAFLLGFGPQPSPGRPQVGPFSHLAAPANEVNSVRASFLL